MFSAILCWDGHLPIVGCPRRGAECMRQGPGMGSGLPGATDGGCTLVYHQGLGIKQWGYSWDMARI